MPIPKLKFEYSNFLNEEEDEKRYFMKVTTRSGEIDYFCNKHEDKQPMKKNAFNDYSQDINYDGEYLCDVCKKTGG